MYEIVITKKRDRREKRYVMWFLKISRMKKFKAVLLVYLLCWAIVIVSLGLGIYFNISEEYDVLFMAPFIFVGVHAIVIFSAIFYIPIGVVYSIYKRFVGEENEIFAYFKKQFS